MWKITNWFKAQLTYGKAVLVHDKPVKGYVECAIVLKVVKDQIGNGHIFHVGLDDANGNHIANIEAIRINHKGTLTIAGVKLLLEIELDG